VLTLAFGERLAGLLIVMGITRANAATAAPANFFRNELLKRGPEQGVQSRRIFPRDDDWVSDPDAHYAAVNAAKFLLDYSMLVPMGR